MVEVQLQGTLFTDDEIAMSGQVQPSAERIKVRVDNRRNSLLQIINRIVRMDAWASAFADQQAMEAEFGGALQTAWNQAYGSSDRNGIIKSLRAQEAKLLEFWDKHEKQLILAEHGLATQEAAEFASKRVLDQLKPQLDARLSAIDVAQRKLDETKKTLHAATSFAGHVTALRTSSGLASWGWTVVIVVVLAGAAWFESTLVVEARSPWYTELFLRLAVLAPVTFLVYFLLGQYKVARLTNVKYQHIEGLLGGGAADLLALFEDRPEFKNRLYERLADTLMSVDDLSGAISGAKTPIQEAVQLLRSTTEAIGDVKSLKG